MASGTEISHRTHWIGLAKRTSRLINFGWWLDAISTPLVVTSLVGAGVILIIRRQFPDLETWTLLSSIAVLVFLLGLVCWWRAARHFENTDQSLVRLEASMYLRNALSAAQAGVSPWPAPLEKSTAGLKWMWLRLVTPPLVAMMLFTGGALIPISAANPEANSRAEQPQAWDQLASELDHLTKEEVIDESYLEETKKQLDQLKSQEEDQWFSHSSLEATDALKKSHRSESERMERELERAAQAVENLQKNGDQTNEAEKTQALEDFQQALQGLENGAMKPNPNLLEQMKKLAPNDFSKLAPEQLQQLKENFKKHREAMNGVPGTEGEDWSDELLAGDGEGDGDGEVKNDQPGRGGVDRGPGHDPKVLGTAKDGVEIGELTGLAAKDLSNSTPGDLLELQNGEHEISQEPSRIRAGGSTEATGKGGDRVWRDALDPAEQRTLKRFFE